MQDRELYRQLLGLEKPWAVSDVKVDFGALRVEVFVEWPEGKEAPCPVCGKEAPLYDHRDERRWRHLDTMQFTTELVCRVPRTNCPEHGVKSISVPWAGQKSRFTALFERLAIEILKNAKNLTAANRILKISWEEADHIRIRAVERGLKRRSVGEVSKISVDEKSFGKGHRYVTVVTDLEGKRVLEVTGGRTEGSLKEALDSLTDAPIEAVAMDMWKPYEEAVAKELPTADIVHDRFHVTRHIGKAIDTVRKQEHKALLAKGDPTLKNSKYLWLTNPENMTDAQRERFNEIRSLELKVNRAYAIGKTFDAFWTEKSVQEARLFFVRWFFWATHSRIKPVIDAAKMLKRHLPNLLTYLEHRITTALSEATNATIQQIKASARGFRNLERFRIAVLFYCGGLDVYPHESR